MEKAIYIIFTVLIIAGLTVVGLELYRPTETGPGTQKFDVICNAEITNYPLQSPKITSFQCNWEKASFWSISDSFSLYDEGTLRIAAQGKTVSTSYKVIEWFGTGTGKTNEKLELRKMDPGETKVTATLFDDDFKQIDSSEITLRVGG